MGVQAKLANTIDEYLALEETSPIKHEYHNGEILAMSGGTLNHSLISGNIVTALKNEIRAQNKSCKTFNSDARVFSEAINHFVYPDATVVCNEIKTNPKDKNAIINPLLIVEVLSDSTGDYDRGKKFRKYRTIPSFCEYVLIDQYQPVVDVLCRIDDQSWKMTTVIGLDKTLYLHSIDCHIKMSDIYLDIDYLAEPIMQFDFVG